ncbi:MAG TPA: hypothetical protein VHN12_11065 [Geobacteraceae bacterium]|nr:hypothetical protein [Geobacteraceae bacterium]
MTILPRVRVEWFTWCRGAFPLLPAGAGATGRQGGGATCGNGHDTLFLARLVGQEGKVWVNRQINRPSSATYVVFIEKVRT